MTELFSPDTFRIKRSVSLAQDSLIDYRAMRTGRNPEISHLAIRQELQDEINHSINELSFIPVETTLESPESRLTSLSNNRTAAQAQHRAEHIRHRRTHAMTEQQFRQILVRLANLPPPPATSPLNNNS